MNLAPHIEHTALKPNLTYDQLETLLQEAIEHGFHGICIPPFWVKKLARDAKNTEVKVVTVIGFPFGYQQTESKIAEIDSALSQGADEIDLVWNLSAFKSGMNWPKIEIAKASKLIHQDEKALKVIIETHYLNEMEIVEACKICEDAGADFVKTSTGYAPTGAVLEEIKLMRSTLSNMVGIKASGGITNRDQAIALILAGADRIGTSSGTKLLK